MKQSQDLQTILVLDFGAQYAQLIARRVRECKVYSEIVPHDISVEEIKRRQPAGLILSGGPESFYAKTPPSLNPELFDLGFPFWGISSGPRLMPTFWEEK